jgi:hypothetical protein
MTLTAQRLGRAGAEWLATQLAGPLGRAVARTVDLTAGQAVAFLPPKARIRSADDLQRIMSWSTPDDPSDSQDLAFALVTALAGDAWIVESAANRRVFEHGTDLKPTHRWFGTDYPPERVAFARDRVLWWRRVEPIDPDVLARDLHGGTSFVVSGVPLPRPDEELSSARLNELASGVRTIVAGAFDEESYVVWTMRVAELENALDRLTEGDRTL